MSEGGKGKSLYDQLTLDLVKTLEKRHGICDIKLTEKPPVDKSAITSWEQKFSCMLADDVANFYLTSNGLLLTWSVKINDGKIPVGHMELNPLERVVRLAAAGSSSEKEQTIPTVLDTEEEDDGNSENSVVPRFDHRSRIFALDPCEGYGKICYVFRNTRPGIPAQKAEVWFLDRSLQWHFLAESFLDYFRLMLAHMGLPQWYYAFTDIGLAPQAKQWFNVYGPIRLSLDNHIYDASQTESFPANSLDVPRVLKGKGDKKVNASRSQKIMVTDDGSRVCSYLAAFTPTIPSQSSVKKGALSQPARKKQLVASAKSSGRTPMPGTTQQYKPMR